MTILRSIGGVGPLVAYAPADAFTTGLSAVQNISVGDAANLLGAPDEPQGGQPADETPPEPAAEAPPEDEESTPDGEDADAEPDEDQPSGDDGEQDEADDDPPIEMPRSWSKEEKEAWASLPRPQQERIAERERARTAEINRRLQETAERAKAIEAETAEAQQAREQYKAAIDQLSAQAASFISNEFQDIKTWDDVAKMQDEDPLRYQKWQVVRERTQALQQEQQRLDQENRQQAAVRFQNYVRTETERFLEARPEFADPKQAPKLQNEVREMLTGDYGVSQEDLAKMWDGAPVSFHDHRFQQIIADALAYRKAKAKVSTKPKLSSPKSPPPQKPGSPPAKGEVKNRVLEKADQDLTRTGSREAALALIEARSR